MGYSYLEERLEKEKEIEAVARNFADARGFFFIGRGLAYPPALRAHSN